MNDWLKAVLFGHGLPVLFGISAFCVITWNGQVLENIFMGLYWLCIAWAGRAWWRKFREEGA